VDVILTFRAGMAVLPLTGSAACPVFRVRVGVAGLRAVEGACRAAGPAPMGAARVTSSVACCGPAMRLKTRPAVGGLAGRTLVAGVIAP
jgi:hypothetical protein